jgi:uncharacterized membrane protein (DUF4010 family)
MELSTVFEVVGIALGLGLLVGLQREHASSRVAGIRTFSLVTVFGVLCALLGQSLGGWIVSAGLVTVGGFVILGNLLAAKGRDADPGITTEVALVVMFGVGTYLVVGERSVAVAVGGLTVVLLHFKGAMHGFADRLGEKDFRAIVQFALVSLVILPVLPNRTYGPYDVLNPYQIWLMVVLIVALSLVGYMVYKLVGDGAGLLTGGLLGGAISSTATTVSYSKRAAASPEVSGAAAVVLAVASAVGYARVVAECGIVAPNVLANVAPPLLAMTGAMALRAAAVWLLGRKEKAEALAHGNPSELWSAVLFAAVYALVTFAAAAANARYGARGLYVVAGLSGLAKIDAITLSTAQLMRSGALDPATGWRLILVGTLSNTVFKTATIGVLGSRELLVRMAVINSVGVAAGVLLLLVWPG